MMLLSQAAQVLGARMLGGDVRFTSVSTDSRTIEAGDLFVALRGENFDGAAFVAGAARDGAVAALVNAEVSTVMRPARCCWWKIRAWHWAGWPRTGARSLPFRWWG